MKDNTNGIIGGSGGNNGAGQQSPEVVTLLPCPCGDDAAWYFTGAGEQPAANETGGGTKPVRQQSPSAVGGLSFGVFGSGGDDRPPNLCDACFAEGVPLAEQGLWTHLETPEQQRRQSSRGDSNEGDQTQGGRVWRE